jgi:hypothetical protein
MLLAELPSLTLAILFAASGALALSHALGKLRTSRAVRARWLIGRVANVLLMVAFALSLIDLLFGGSVTDVKSVRVIALTGAALLLIGGALVRTLLPSARD